MELLLKRLPRNVYDYTKLDGKKVMFTDIDNKRKTIGLIFKDDVDKITHCVSMSSLRTDGVGNMWISNSLYVRLLPIKHKKVKK